MRTKEQSIRTPEDISQSWGETPIIEIIREAYASDRNPEQLIRERSSRRGRFSGPLDARIPGVSEKLALVTIYERKDGFFQSLWRVLKGG